MNCLNIINYYENKGDVVLKGVGVVILVDGGAFDVSVLLSTTGLAQTVLTGHNSI